MTQTIIAYVPKPGDLGIVSTNGLAARLIQVGTVSRWNHVFIYIGPTLVDGISYDMVEATPSGVKYGNTTEYTNIVYNKHQVFNNEEVDRAFIVAYARGLVNKPYNWVNIFRIAFRILGLKIFANTKLMKHLASKDGYICSEAGEEAYEKSGNPLVLKDAGETSPGDLVVAFIYQ